MQLVIQAGMKAPGLPLINPNQAGTIWTGIIVQPYGNWVADEMSIDFVTTPAPHSYTIRKPGPFVFNWPSGVSLQTALTNCFSMAYNGLKAPIFKLGQTYVNNFDVVHMVSTFQQVQTLVRGLTKSSALPGVFMAINPDQTIHVWDTVNVSTANAVDIVFTDLIGQPTWIAPNLMQFQTVMRADLQANTLITMPSGLGNVGGVIATPAAFPGQQGPQYKTAFQGTFSIVAIRHLGNFRDAKGASWVSIFKAVPVPGSTPQQLSGNPAPVAVA